MAKLNSLWLSFVFFLWMSFSVPLVAKAMPHPPLARSTDSCTSTVNQLISSQKVLKTNMFSTVELAHNYKAPHLVNFFDLGQLTVSTPYLPECSSALDQRSEACLNFNLPELLGGFKVHGGVSYNLECQAGKKFSSAQEHVVYVVSTKQLSDNRYKPFVSLSYVRSSVRDISKVKNIKALQHKPAYVSQAKYANTEAMETCCGIQPLENLSMILSYNYLKPLHKGDTVTQHSSKEFDRLKTQCHTSGVDLKLDYAVREGLNFLVQSEYLVPNRTLRDSVDAPVMIEGTIVVSF